MTTTPEFRARLLSRYVSTHATVTEAAAQAGLEKRRAYLDKLVREHFPADRHAAVLDLGCGHGAILWAANHAGYTNLVGVDASPEQVTAAKHLGIRGVRQGDLLECVAATPDASQDVVILFDLYHYFERDAQMKLADEVRRILKPGGRWILHLPNSEALFSGRMRYWDHLAIDSFTRISIAQLLLACGFARVDCFEDKPIVHGLKSAVRAILWCGVRGVLRLALAAETGETGRDAIFSQVFLAVARK
jgi:SAM-dependent methyltransferase